MNVAQRPVLCAVLACLLAVACRTGAREGVGTSAASASASASVRTLPPVTRTTRSIEPWLYPSAPPAPKLPSTEVCGVVEIDPNHHQLAHGRFIDWLEFFDEIGLSQVPRPATNDAAKSVLCDAAKAATPSDSGCAGPSPYLFSGLTHHAYLVGETKGGLIVLMASAASKPYQLAVAELHRRADAQLVLGGFNDSINQYQLIDWPALTGLVTVTLDRAKNDELPPAKQTTVVADVDGFVVQGPGCGRQMAWAKAAR